MSNKEKKKKHCTQGLMIMFFRLTTHEKLTLETNGFFNVIQYTSDGILMPLITSVKSVQARFICKNCCRSYAWRSGLWKHKQKINLVRKAGGEILEECPPFRLLESSASSIN